MSETTPEQPDPAASTPQAVPAPPAETPAPPVAPPPAPAAEAPAPPPPAPAAPVPAAPAATAVPVFPNGKPMLDAFGNPVSTKSRLAAALLCWFVGIVGVHRFYVGKIGTGVLMIVTLGGLGIWVIVDFVVILLGSFRDKSGKALQNW